MARRERNSLRWKVIGPWDETYAPTAVAAHTNGRNGRDEYR